MSRELTKLSLALTKRSNLLTKLDAIKERDKLRMKVQTITLMMSKSHKELITNSRDMKRKSVLL
jgi:hypothetical protein